MRTIESTGLIGVPKLLDLGQGGSDTAPIEFDDKNVQQALDVSKILRRGNAVAGTSGIFGAGITHTHVGTGQLTTSIDVYNLTTGLDAIPPFPSPIPEELDLWILGKMRLNVNDAADFANAVLDIVIPGIRGFGLLGQGSMPLMAWDGVAALLTSSPFGTEIGTGKVTGNDTAWRVPRNGLLRLRSLSDNAGTVIVSAEIAVALLPTGLGQDAIGAG